MDRNEINDRLLPASQWREFPMLKNRLKGHWGLYLTNRWNYETKQSDQLIAVDRIERKRGNELKVGHTHKRLYEVWVLPDTVPLSEHWPTWSHGSFRNLSKDEAMGVLSAALQAVNAPRWAWGGEVTT